LTPAEAGPQTVPDELLGCWRRNWIRFGDNGPLQRDVAVVWLQTASGMGDLRIDPSQAPHESDSSCGVTVVDETTEPFVTATWHNGETGFSQQPVSRFPEPGWLVWDSGTIMRELAPSGAYVEQWELLPRSHGVVAHYVATKASTTTNLYVAGAHHFVAIERSDEQAVHELSYGVRDTTTSDTNAEVIVIEMSTIPSRVGRVMQLDCEWQLQSQRTRLLNPRP